MALRSAEASLTAIGFRIEERTAESLVLVGPDMSSTRQNALVGASRISLRCSRESIAVEADLGGVMRMSRFVTVFPIGLVLGLATVLSVVFTTLFGPGIWIIAARLIARAGFCAYQVAGFALVGARYAFPDIDLIQYYEENEAIRQLVTASPLPVIMAAGFSHSPYPSTDGMETTDSVEPPKSKPGLWPARIIFSAIWRGIRTTPSWSDRRDFRGPH